nr:hypothetical protein [Tanacetum cinerariifolium]
GNNGLYKDYLDDSVNETEGVALDDPDGAHIDPIHKVCREVLVTKKTKKNLFHDEDAESSKSDKSTKCTKSAKSAAKCTKSAAKSTKSGKA